MAYSDNPLNPFKSMGPNFGLLDTRQSQPDVRIVQNPNSGMEQEKGLLAGMSSMEEGLRTAQEMKNSNNMIADRNARLKMDQELQPGRLAQQGAELQSTQARTALTNLMAQGEAVTNAQKKIKLAGDQLDWKQRQDAISAAQSGGLASWKAAMQKQGNFAAVAQVDHLTSEALRSDADASLEQTKANAAQMAASNQIVSNIMKAPPEQQSTLFKQQLPNIERFDPKVTNYINPDDPQPAQISSYAVGTAAAAQMLGAKVASEKQTTLQQNTQFLADLKSKADAGDKDAQQKLDIAQGLGSGNKKTLSVAGEIWSPAGQKRFTDLSDKMAQAKTLMQYTNVGKSLLDDAEKQGIKFGPGIGTITGKAYEVGQELSKINASLVPQTVNILGVKATALRSAAMIQLVKDMNPSTANYASAQKWIFNFMHYLSATDLHEAWSEQNSMMEQLKDQDPKGVANWKEAHPDPMQEVETPNFNELYKINPKFESLGLEQSVKEAQQAGLGKQEQTVQPAPQTQYSPQDMDMIRQEAIRRGLIQQ